MKIIQFFFNLIFAFLITFNCCALPIGIINAERDSCENPFNRPGSFVVPAYALGCWLNTPFTEAKN